MLIFIFKVFNIIIIHNITSNIIAVHYTFHIFNFIFYLIILNVRKFKRFFLVIACCIISFYHKSENEVQIVGPNTN